MTPERHERIGEHFLAARELTGEQREAYLAEACADDPRLRNEIRGLLSADAQEDTFLGNPTAHAHAVKAQSDAGRRFIGKRVGRFTIQRVIAQGGMGTVYEAVQDNPRRVVALKMIRLGLSAPAALRRFEYEAQMLSRLQHPAIAQVFDAGVHEGEADPVPYFAMEFVADAQSLIHYVKTAALPLRSQLDLCATVCDAVHHAHQNGVIHRDLKPENILVDAAGQPKVIDFGVARVFEQDDGYARMQTTVGHLVGTVPYMSPEQVRGHSDRIDIRTDVYSLGIILYQLLTDRFPYTVEGNLTDVMHNILHVEPAAPSSHGTRVESELVTIVLKCLQKDPQRRYQSAGELGRDIVHHLKGEPIEAKRDSGWYVVRKTLRRHRIAVAAVAAFIILITASAIALLFMNQLQRTQRLRAEREAANSERQAYIANITAADLALVVNDAGQALKCLEHTPERLRHWEYSYLVNRADSSILTLPSPEPAHRVTFSPDGSTLTVGYGSGTVRNWNLAQGGFFQEYKTLTSVIEVLAYSVDGTRLGACAIDSTAAVWSVSTGSEINHFAQPTVFGDQHTTSLSPDFVLLGRSRTSDPIGMIPIYDVFDVASRQRLVEFPVTPPFAIRAEFSPCGTRLATGGGDGSLTEWDLGTGGLRYTTIPTGSMVRSIAYSPDGGMIVVGHQDGPIVVRDSSSGAPVRTLSGHSSGIQSLAFSSDGSFVGSASQDKTIQVWDVHAGTMKATLVGHRFAVCDLAFHPLGGLLASVSEFEGEVKLWQFLEKPAPIRVKVVTFDPWPVFDPAGRYLMLLHNSLEAHILDLESGEVTNVFDRSSSLTVAAVYGSHGAELIFGGVDGSLRFVDPSTGAETRVLCGHDGHIEALAVSPDGLRLASVGGDAMASLWDMERGEVVHLLNGHTARISSVQFGPDGSLLATSSLDKTAKVWDVQTGRCILTLSGHTGGVFGAAFSPDGQRVVTTSYDGTFRIWDTVTGRTLLNVHGRMLDVWGAAFSPDGKRLVTGARDSTVRIWDAETGDELLILRGLTGTVRRVAWSPDGRRIAAGSHNGEVFIWDAPPPPPSK